MSAPPRPLLASWLGRVEYLAAWRLQEAVAARVRAGAPDRLLLLEHDPVYTIGRRGSLDHLTAPAAELRALGAAAYRVDRGGDITYHGPGQVVGYPVVALGDAPDLVGYVRAVEGGLVDALATLGVAARPIEGKTGVWVEARGRLAKIAAIGVRVSRRTTTHGFALNVRTALDAFARMIPCGFAHDVASLRLLGIEADVADIARRCADALAARLGRELRWNGAPEPPREDELAADAPVRAAVDLLREPIAAG